MHYLFEPGLLSSGPVRTALIVGTVVAVTSGVIGVFTVIRGQSFAGHALADVATTGGAGAFLVGINQFWGFLAAGIAAAALVEGVGLRTRVLLLTALSSDLARAKGVPVRAVGIGYLAALAVSVSLAAVAIGAVLSTALLIGPSATPLRIA